MKYLALICGLLLLSACKTYTEDELSTFDKEIEEYIAENNLDLERSDSGLYYRIIEAGEGRKIQFKDVIRFKYTGELLDGTVFDEQMEEPLEFEVSKLIGAWKEIMLELSEGGKAYLIAPPSLGYGTHNLEDIPSNSILIYNMEIVEVR